MLHFDVAKMSSSKKDIGPSAIIGPDGDGCVRWCLICYPSAQLQTQLEPKVAFLLKDAAREILTTWGVSYAFPMVNLWLHMLSFGYVWLMVPFRCFFSQPSLTHTLF